MKNITYTTLLLLMSVCLFAQDPNCSSYLAEITDGPNACANQPYLLQVPLNSCPGTISFCFDITSDFFTSELSVDLLDNTGTIVTTYIQTGEFANGTQPGQICSGDLDATQGPYTLAINDSFGDSNDGDIVITDVNNANNTLYTTTFGNDDGDGTTNPFSTFNLSPAVISPLSTVTVNWYENGAIVQTEANIECNTFFRQYSLTSSAICQTEAQTIGYEVVCDLDGSTLASNLAIPVTVYPPVAPAIADLVSITISDDAANPGCAAPVIVYQNDCTAAEVQVTESTAAATCVTDGVNVTGNATYDVTYIGPAGGPDCCATGGPQVPVNDSGTNSDNLVTTIGPSDQFTPNPGTNNAAGFSYNTPTPGCGIATISDLTFNICNIQHISNFEDDDLPPTGQDQLDAPGVQDNENYFVTIYVNGVQ